jgi:hypothetical protein
VRAENYHDVVHPRLDLATAKQEPGDFMAPAETAQPRGHMKAASLLCVFIVARLVILSGYDLEWLLRTPLALFWQDTAFVLGFALLEKLPRSRFVITGLYWLIALYVALNVPVVRMFSTPLTWPMLGATRGTLSDSIGHHVDIANLAGIGLVLATALMAPMWLRRTDMKPGPRFYSLVTALCVLGFWSSIGIDTAGLQRNCIATLISSGREQVVPVAHAADWRRASTAERSLLASWQGTAKGRNVVDATSCSSCLNPPARGT